KKLPTPLRKSIFSRREEIEVYTINPREAGQAGEGDVAENIVLELAFLKLIGWREDIHKMVQELSSNGTNFDTVLQDVTTIKENIDNCLRRLEIPASWGEIEDAPTLPSIPRG